MTLPLFSGVGRKSIPRTDSPKTLQDGLLTSLGVLNFEADQSMFPDILFGDRPTESSPPCA